MLEQVHAQKHHGRVRNAWLRGNVVGKAGSRRITARGAGFAQRWRLALFCSMLVAVQTQERFPRFMLSCSKGIFLRCRDQLLPCCLRITMQSLHAHGLTGPAPPPKKPPAFLLKARVKDPYHGHQTYRCVFFSCALSAVKLFKALSSHCTIYSFLHVSQHFLFVVSGIVSFLYRIVHKG